MCIKLCLWYEKTQWASEIFNYEGFFFACSLNLSGDLKHTENPIRPQQTKPGRVQLLNPCSPPPSPHLCRLHPPALCIHLPQQCADQTTLHHWDWTGDPEVHPAGAKRCLAMPQPSVSGMEPPFGDDFQNYSFADQALTSTELLATSADPDFMYELVSDTHTHTHTHHCQPGIRLR
ncbi:hypothetical protein PAMP_007193 [Pampus punctatissimus]